MRHIGKAIESSFPLLSEEQNASFNREFHSEEELAAKFMLLQEWMKDRPFDVLDLGGVNGAFVDRFSIALRSCIKTPAGSNTARQFYTVCETEWNQRGCGGL